MAPWPALSATRCSLTDDDAIKAAMLEVPGPVASGAANDMSSIVTEPCCTPVTKSAYAEGGAVTCALCPDVRPDAARRASGARQAAVHAHGAP